MGVRAHHRTPGDGITATLTPCTHHLQQYITVWHYKVAPYKGPFATRGPLYSIDTGPLHLVVKWAEKTVRRKLRFLNIIPFSFIEGPHKATSEYILALLRRCAKTAPGFIIQQRDAPPSKHVRRRYIHQRDPTRRTPSTCRSC